MAPTAWRRHQNLAGAELSLETLTAKAAECVPEAKLVRPAWREASFTLPDAAIRIHESVGLARMSAG